ncbi:SHOCT domain-containing protein [Streptomyces sp. NBC_01456]|uniref:SHOCT domain-containing protein n=1 Tax=unclassified Streptomyces TaxID=2593676 RepID=UPI002E33301F|nr:MULTISPECIES: SHOCT domain-containing protein [unclassified Streptomyces]
MFTFAAPWAGGGPGPWILFVPVLWAAVAFGVITLLSRTVWRRGGPRGHLRGPQLAARGDVPSPLAVLGRRFAAGEIDEEEYWRRLSVLEEHFATGPKGGAA